MSVALFKNMRAVIRAETECRKNGITVQIMPIPEHISAECGMCLHFEGETNKIYELMQQAAIEVTIYDKI